MQITRNDISETKVEFTVKAGLEELTHAKQGELKEVFRDGKLLIEHSLSEIRNRII